MWGLVAILTGFTPSFVQKSLQVKNLRQSRKLENMNRSKRVDFVPPKGGSALK
jgi:hypothetical protein